MFAKRGQSERRSAAPVVRRWPGVALCLVWLSIVGAGSASDVRGAPGSAASAPDAQAAVLELRTAFRDIPHASPWRIDVLQRKVGSAVYLGDDTFLTFEPALDRAIGSTLRLPRDLEISAHLLHLDRSLGLAMLRIDRQGAEAAGWPEPPVTRIAQEFDYQQRGARLDLVGVRSEGADGPRKHSVFFEGMGSGAFEELTGDLAREVPVMQFSGWTAGVGPGDLLFAPDSKGGRLVGIVLRFDRGDRYGYALPAVLLEAYIEQQRTARTRAAASVLCDPGFRYEAVASRAARSYYGLGPSTEGALVTHVMPYLRVVRDRLLVGDVIVGVDGQRLGPGVSLPDKRFGRLPLGALLGFSGGRPVPAGTRIRLEVSRKRQLRTVEIEAHPFVEDYLRVPRYFTRPAYLLTGGLVFVELSDRYLAEIGTHPTGADSDPIRRWPRLSFLAQSRRLSTRADGSRYVVLDRVLPVRSNQGEAMYTEETERPLLLLSLNGVAVRSLSHLKRMMLEHLEGGRDLAFGLEGGKLIVLDGEKLAAADEEVRARYAIPYLQANLD